MLLQRGETLQNRYTVEKLLGQGGMGSVYLARQEALGGRRVAVKEMVASLHDADRDRAIEQFKLEASMLASLEHPNLVEVLDYFSEGEHHYLVMSFVNGTTLESVLDEQGRVPVPRVLEWMDQLCDVLDYLHNRTPPIIFRDLKPSNIMLDDRGNIRLIDFGIARVFNPQIGTSSFIKGAGTPGFAPVEQYGVGSTDPRTDVYALGATLFTLLTCRIPPASVAIMGGEETILPPSAYNRHIPLELDKVVLRMMGLRKEDRFQSIARAREALRRLDIAAPAGEETRNLNCSDCGTPVHPATRQCLHCDTRRAPGFDEDPTVLPEIFHRKHEDPTVLPEIFHRKQRDASTVRPMAEPHPRSTRLQDVVGLPRGLEVQAAAVPVPLPGPSERVQTVEEVAHHGRWVMSLAGVVVALFFAVPYLAGPTHFTPLDWLNFPFHMAGRVMFSLWGSPRASALGAFTLPVVVPLLATCYFFSVRRGFDGCCTLYWMFQNVCATAAYLLTVFAVEGGGTYHVPFASEALALVTVPHELVTMHDTFMLFFNVGRLGLVVSLAAMAVWLVLRHPQRKDG